MLEYSKGLLKLGNTLSKFIVSFGARWNSYFMYYYYSYVKTVADGSIETIKDSLGSYILFTNRYTGHKRLHVYLSIHRNDRILTLTYELNRKPIRGL